VADDAQPLLLARDHQQPLRSGAVALVVEEGRAATDAVLVQPAGAGAA
jgi:hypothetical protein